MVVKDGRRFTAKDFAFIGEATVKIKLAATWHRRKVQMAMEEYKRIKEIRTGMKDYLKGQTQFQ